MLEEEEEVVSRLERRKRRRFYLGWREHKGVLESLIPSSARGSPHQSLHHLLGLMGKADLCCVRTATTPSRAGLIGLDTMLTLREGVCVCVSGDGWMDRLCEMGWRGREECKAGLLKSWSLGLELEAIEIGLY